MNNAKFQADVRPNLPLRPPATSLGNIPKIITPPFGEKKSCLTPNSNVTAMANAGEGNFRCTRCKRTYYCSVACQTEDWKAHRHICKPSTEEATRRNKTPEPVASPAVRADTVEQVKRVYLHELPRKEVSKGTELQASVMELRNPGKFFIHIQSVEMMETLRTITMALQKAYASSLGAEYLPDLGELCAVRYSQDKNWYRGAVQSVDASSKTASIFYIDFGNEEVVTLDWIQPLCAGVSPNAPCAVACRVAGMAAATGNWTEECCISARQLVMGKSLLVTVVDVSDDTGVWAVDFMLPAIGKKLSTFLLEQRYAVEETREAEDPNLQDIDSILSAALENFRRSSGGKQESMGAPHPEPLTQGLGDSFSAMVTHVQSPSELICQKVENASVIQELQMKLREYCALTPISEDFRPAPGSVCCSQFTEDRQWYRATVLGYSSETSVCVGYIDFGNSEEVDVSCLRPISAELAALPMQAIPCVLSGVKPVLGKWSDEAILLLKKLVCNKFVRVEIVGNQQGAALVVLTDERSDPQTNVSELLLATGHALPDNSSPPQATEHTLTADATPPCTDKMEEAAVNTPCSSPLEWSCAEIPCDGQVVELVISLIESPDEFYCHLYNAEGVEPLQGQWGRDAVHGFRALSVGRQLQARVRSITERGFGVELVSDGQNIAALLVAEDFAKAKGAFVMEWKTVELPRNKPFQPHLGKVPALMADLAEHCDWVPKAHPDPSSPQPGAACCAQLPGDRKWYRAVVLKVEGSEAEVVCADYGNVERIPVSNLLPISKRHLDPPFQIVRCALAAQWTPSVLEMFSAQLQSRVLASVESFDGSCNLLVLTLTGYTVQEASNAGSPVPQTTPSEQGTTATSKLAATSTAPATEGAEKMPAAINEGKVGPVTKAGSVPVETNSREEPQPDIKKATTDASPPSSDRKCCCSHLIQKIDQLEELIVQLMTQIGAPSLRP
ncbi:hypothetical protein JZ751_025899 [Albula glossodonta]|uniref:Tudor domain-containing protein 1 n=1 Tax=Albula glossodonta TaxID=121402 RepID=A0A8T2NL25_9TELE|nr:hypothetical protein JZ751_025899 [Albula glossodonta]